MATGKTRAGAAAGKSGARKPAGARGGAGRAAKPTLVVPEPQVEGATEPAEAGTAALRRNELVDLVVARSNGKKKEVKPAVEAMLAVLGELLASGRELNLPPLGKLRVSRIQEKPNGRVIVCKLRQGQGGAARPGPDGGDTDPEDPLAEPVE